jgi:hypothetical protein
MFNNISKYDAYVEDSVLSIISCSPWHRIIMDLTYELDWISSINRVIDQSKRQTDGENKIFLHI